MNSNKASYLSIAFTNRDLCTRCGTCVGACPVEALSVGPDFFPEVDENICTRCGLCKETCPGGHVNYADITELTFGHRNDNVLFDGHVRTVYFGHANDERIRAGGAGGGVITALLWDLLNRKVVDGCIVTRMDPDRPWFGKVYIARTYDELLESQQSKYIVIPMNSILQQIRRETGRFAYAGLPCHIHGLRLLLDRDPVLRERIHCVIGLFCASAMEPCIATDFLAARGIRPEDILDFKFRDGMWPGRICAVLRDGERRPLHQSNFKDGAINYMTYLYSPPRCQTCIDGSAEFSDISVSDAWTRDSRGNYLAGGQSRLLVRTGTGERLVREACESGALVAREVSNDKAYQTHRLHTRKKGMSARLRVARYRRLGWTSPEYDRPAPEATTGQHLEEWMESAIMSLGRIPRLRYVLFTFLTSRWGLPFIWIRQARKRWKYRDRSRG
jgi:coenzyme F420 hydrogenase subunit beta